MRFQCAQERTKYIHVCVTEYAVACLGSPLVRACCVAHEVLAILLPSAAQRGVLEWSIHLSQPSMSEFLHKFSTMSTYGIISLTYFAPSHSGSGGSHSEFPTNALRRYSLQPFDAHPHTNPSTWGYSGASSPAAAQRPVRLRDLASLDAVDDDRILVPALVDCPRAHSSQAHPLEVGWPAGLDDVRLRPVAWTRIPKPARSRSQKVASLPSAFSRSTIRLVSLRVLPLSIVSLRAPRASHQIASQRHQIRGSFETIRDYDARDRED